ncbi:MAG: hypothetical protein GXY01_00535 [Clostridiales bacterium]|mgnify:CR=1 FL=1|nr:hypothetical protein [Clostridiales bacterium]
MDSYLNTSTEQLTHGAKEAPIIAARDRFQFVDGRKTEKREGSAYTILLPDGKSLAVKVEDSALAVTQESINAAYVAGRFIMADFVELQIRPYVDKTGKQQFSARAKEILISHKDTKAGVI